jgi:hypothetical protein
MLLRAHPAASQVSRKTVRLVWFRSAHRLALPAAGGTRLAHETDKTQSHEKSHFSGENPAVRVHAVLGVFLPRALLILCQLADFGVFLLILQVSYQTPENFVQMESHVLGHILLDNFLHE